MSVLEILLPRKYCFSNVKSQRTLCSDFYESVSVALQEGSMEGAKGLGGRGGFLTGCHQRWLREAPGHLFVWHLARQACLGLCLSPSPTQPQFHIAPSIFPLTGPKWFWFPGASRQPAPAVTNGSGQFNLFQRTYRYWQAPRKDPGRFPTDLQQAKAAYVQGSSKRAHSLSTPNLQGKDKGPGYLPASPPTLIMCHYSINCHPFPSSPFHPSFLGLGEYVFVN